MNATLPAGFQAGTPVRGDRLRSPGRRRRGAGGAALLAAALLLPWPFAAWAQAPAMAGKAAGENVPPPEIASPPAIAASPAGDTRGIAAGRSLSELFASGGPLMWPILLCSVIMVAFVLERAVGLRRRRIFPPRLAAGLLAVAREGNVAEALARCLADRSPFARLMQACLQRADEGGFEMERALEEAGARLLYDLRRNCKPLAVTADVAPLLGLMGTVTGMIRAFDVVARSGALGRAELLAEGIAEALLTTAFGLLVAVPAIIFHHLYRAKAENLLREMEDAALDILAALRAASRPREAGASAS